MEALGGWQGTSESRYISWDLWGLCSQYPLGKSLWGGTQIAPRVGQRSSGKGMSFLCQGENLRFPSSSRPREPVCPSTQRRTNLFYCYYVLVDIAIALVTQIPLPSNYPSVSRDHCAAGTVLGPGVKELFSLRCLQSMADGRWNRNNQLRPYEKPVWTGAGG